MHANKTVVAYLAEWVDWDVAAYLLGRGLGIFNDQDFREAKGAFRTGNDLGNGIKAPVPTSTSLSGARPATRWGCRAFISMICAARAARARPLQRARGDDLPARHTRSRPGDREGARHRTER